MSEGVLGILGGGQLGWMLALAGHPLALRARFIDPAPDASAGRVAEQIVGIYSDTNVLNQFIPSLQVVTYEFENVPVETVRWLEQFVPVHPAAQALEVAQDRLAEKTFFQRLGIPTAPFAPVATRVDLQTALVEIGLPAVLKTRRFGYDGKGQFVLRESEEIDQVWAALGGAPLILEGFVRFERELSILAVRGHDGSIGYYPLVENHHRDGILRRSFAPAPQLTPNLQAQAEGYATRVLEHLDYVGVLAIELFQDHDNLLVNEMAPRVHNSGHWTIEGAETSQFENHLRAIMGLPLGSTEPRGHSVMLNLIGTLPDPAVVLTVPGAHIHLYGKEPRPGRKLGHITLRADDLLMLEDRLRRLKEVVTQLD